MRILCAFLALLLLLTAAFAESRSVWAGVYPKEQAARGVPAELIALAIP